MIRRKLVTRRNRRKPDPAVTPSGTDAVASFAIVANKARLTFSVPIVVSGTLQMTVNAALPTSQTLIAPNVVDLGYLANVVATQVAVIPAKDAGIRTSTGGYVAPATHTF